jgi:hypothetical protein
VKACVGDATSTVQVYNGTVPHFICGNTVSFIIAANSSIMLLSPNITPVVWNAGSTQTISWQSTGVGSVGITFCFGAPNYQCNNTAPFGGSGQILTNLPPSGQKTVNIPNPSPGQELTVVGKIRVYDMANPVSVYAESNSDVTIISSNFPG